MGNLNGRPFKEKSLPVPPKRNKTIHKQNENIKCSNLNNFFSPFSTMFAKFQFGVDYNGHTVLHSLKKCNWSLATMT